METERASTAGQVEDGKEQSGVVRLNILIFHLHKTDY